MYNTSERSKTCQVRKFHVAVTTGYAAFEPKPSKFTALLLPLPRTGTVLALSLNKAINEWSLHCAGTNTESGSYASAFAVSGPPTTSLGTAGACNETETISHGRWGCLCGNFTEHSGR